MAEANNTHIITPSPTAAKPRRVFRPIRIVGAIAYVPLTKGYEALIDAADAPLIEAWCWYAHVRKSGHVYAARNAKVDGKNTIRLMHVELMGGPSPFKIDHKDGNGLNNSRKNIRFATHQQNMQNRVLDRRNRFGRKGVFWGENGKFRACIQHNGRTIHLGTYSTQEEAGAAYAGAAKALFKEFARLE